VDRRSRERLLESNNQISALVEKFKIDGEPFLRSLGSSAPPMSPDADAMDLHARLPLTAYGKPGALTIFWTLVK
jgi:hypothetical protein